jgi:hypothetical protein
MVELPLNPTEDVVCVVPTLFDFDQSEQPFKVAVPVTLMSGDPELLNASTQGGATLWISA